MKKIKEFIIKYGSSLAAFAFVVNTLAIGKNCRFFFHEPEVPKELMAYKKDK